MPDEELNHISIDYYNDFYKAAHIASEEGELVINIPPNVQNTKTKEDRYDLRIYYQLLRPKSGVYFVTTDSVYPNRFIHMHTNNQIAGARLWFPCVDTLYDRCTFQFEITVHSSLLVICSGDLQRQLLSDDRSKRTFYFSIDGPLLPQNIGMAVGPFEVLPLKEETESKYANIITSFCLPNRMKELEHTTSHMSQMISFYEEYLGASFPCKTYKQVFVEEPFQSVSGYSTITMLSTHLLHDESIIDQTYKSRRKLAFGVASQWFSNFITVRTWSDYWIVIGLSGYLADLYYKKAFGNNEYRFRLFTQSDYTALYDNVQPLYYSNYGHPFDVIGNKIFKKKAALVMYAIERRVGPDSFRKVLSSLVSPSYDSDLDKNLSTKKFLKIIRKVTGNDLRPFAERWIYGKGCPNLSCGFVFNKRKHIIEFALKQNKKPLIPGSVYVRVNELEGTYDHIVNFDEEIHQFEFPCYSRVRKARKKKTKGGEDKDGNGGETTGNDLNDDESKKNETPVLWVRVDPELDIVRTITMRQPETMWIIQLQRDTDVIAQFESIVALQSYCNSFPTIEALNKVLNDNQIYYKLRIQAAIVMSHCTLPAGVDLLLKFFKTHYYDPEGNQIRPNDFSDFSSYFLQMGVESALAAVKRADNKTTTEVLEFILDILKNNDNTANMYSDNFYLANLIKAIPSLDTSKPSDTNKLTKQIERILNLEKIMPSYHNILTIASLESLCTLQLNNRIPVNYNLFKEYTKYGNYEQVRVTAIRCLQRLGIHKENTLSFLLDLIDRDKSNFMKCKILECLMTAPSYSNASIVINNITNNTITMDDNVYFAPFLKESIENTNMVRRLWTLLNSPESGYDYRLRYQIRRFIVRLYGLGIPKVLGKQDLARKIVIRKAEPTVVGLSTKPPLKRRPLELGPASPPPPIHLPPTPSSSSSNNVHQTANNNLINNNNNNNNNPLPITSTLATATAKEQTPVKKETLVQPTSDGKLRIKIKKPTPSASSNTSISTNNNNNSNTTSSLSNTSTSVSKDQPAEKESSREDTHHRKRIKTEHHSTEQGNTSSSSSSSSSTKHHTTESRDNRESKRKENRDNMDVVVPTKESKTSHNVKKERVTTNTAPPATTTAPAPVKVVPQENSIKIQIPKAKLKSSAISSLTLQNKEAPKEVPKENSSRETDPNAALKNKLAGKIAKIKIRVENESVLVKDLPK